MNPSSPDALESTRKIAARIQAVILQRLAAVTQEHAAACMGVSPSTVSRTVTDGLERICQLIAALDLQVSGADSMVVDPRDIEAAERFAYLYLKAKIARYDHQGDS